MRLSVLCVIAILMSALPLCAQDTATVRAADGFQYPVGPSGTGEGYYIARGYRPNGHLGEDWNGVRGGDTDLGDPVYATANGFVTFARNYHVGWGNVVIIRHAYYEGSTLKYVDSLYGHLLDFSVQEGEQIKRGQKIGRIGNNSGMYEAHLHFEMRKNLQIGMFRSSFPRDFSNYYSPNEFVATHRFCPSGNHMVSIPINTYAPVAPPVLAGPHVESPMSGPPSAGGSPHFIRIAPFPTSAPVVVPTPTPPPKVVIKAATPTPAPSTPEPKIAKSPAATPTPAPSTASKSPKSGNTPPVEEESSSQTSKSTAATASPTPKGKSAAKGGKGATTASTKSTKKGETLPPQVADDTKAPSTPAPGKVQKAPPATPAPQPPVATREPETINSEPLFPATPVTGNTNTSPIRRAGSGYKVDRFEDMRGKAGF